MRFKRIFLLVLDSVGVGASYDAALYGDEGANTLGNIINKSPIKIPNLRKLGVYNILGLENDEVIGYYTKAKPISNGKDTMVGHYELMGLRTETPYKTWTDTGFPIDLINEIERRTGYKVIGNKAASGTEIIEELGKEHLYNKSIIVYTSADPVIQIAAHEQIIPLEDLYKICKIVREITLKDEWKVGRVIARPFIGTPGNFIRTDNRHDYSLKPPKKTVLDHLKDNDYKVISIGKIADIFDKEGITDIIKAGNNLEGIEATIRIIKEDFTGLCFTNLNDFDSKYGHRRDVAGYAESLEEFDSHLPEILEQLNYDDLFIITADHGNDPSYKGTDHTRENIPVMIYSKSLIGSGFIDFMETFADIGFSICDNFNITTPEIGSSFLSKIK